jgi:adenylate cyclase
MKTDMPRSAEDLLKTYLGERTGARVLAGQTTRGEGERIHAVIWLCDLRDSTRLSESMPVEGFFRSLNDFFDCTAGAVLEHGGEVLTYIGDAVLAIFPIDGRRRGAGASPLEFGLALHVGDLMYGNLGVSRRMQFTVIGAAANEAARLAGMCRELGQWVLVSSAFPQCFPNEMISLGHHDMRGVDAPQEIFTLIDQTG